jgi:DNA-dependent protein kinase catalytic subunit
VVEQLLNAIKLSSYEARQRFPRLLQIVALYTAQTADAFVDATSRTPCWMFLGWLSQMTALLDKPESRVIQTIVHNIAHEYPQAFVYPFRMSVESFKLDCNTPREQRDFIDKLMVKVQQRIPLAAQFIAALEQLNTPHLMFKDYADEILKNLKNRELIVKNFQELFVNVVDWCSAAGEDGSGSGSVVTVDGSATQLVEWGVIRKNFAKFVKPQFEAEFGESGRNITGLSDAQIGERIKKLVKIAEDYAKSSKDGNLGEYSPWLKNFKRNIAKDLEIPGKTRLRKK